MNRDAPNSLELIASLPAKQWNDIQSSADARFDWMVWHLHDLPAPPHSKWRDDHARIAEGSHFGWRNSRNAKLNEIDLSSRQLNGIVLTGSNISRVDFSHCTLRAAKFDDCAIERTNFSGALLYGVDFGRSNLKDVNFSQSILYCCSFQGSTLQSTRFSGADICPISLKTLHDRRFLHFRHACSHFRKKCRSTVLKVWWDGVHRAKEFVSPK